MCCTPSLASTGSCWENSQLWTVAGRKTFAGQPPRQRTAPRWQCGQPIALGVLVSPVFRQQQSSWRFFGCLLNDPPQTTTSKSQHYTPRQQTQQDQQLSTSPAVVLLLLLLLLRTPHHTQPHTSKAASVTQTRGLHPPSLSTASDRVACVAQHAHPIELKRPGGAPSSNTASMQPSACTWHQLAPQHPQPRTRPKQQLHHQQAHPPVTSFKTSSNPAAPQDAQPLPSSSRSSSNGSGHTICCCRRARRQAGSTCGGHWRGPCRSGRSADAGEAGLHPGQGAAWHSREPAGLVLIGCCCVSDCSRAASACTPTRHRQQSRT